MAPTGFTPLRWPISTASTRVSMPQTRVSAPRVPPSVPAFADAFSDGAGVVEAGIEPFDHLSFPVGHARQRVPAPRSVSAVRNANDVASHAHLLERGLQIGRLGEGNVLVPVAQDLEKGRRVLADISDG